MTDGGERLEIARRAVELERVAGLVDRGRQLAAALARGAFLSVAAGGSHSLALATDGSLWAWGDNGSGQLGLGDTQGRSRPTRLGGEGDWATVAAGREHSLALKRDGSLWQWGGSFFGDGMEDTEDCEAPQCLGDDRDWATLAGGDDYSLAVKRDGSLWAWGGNSFGRLGLGGFAVRWYATPTRVGDDDDWASVSASDPSCTFALKSDGSLWAWGSNWTFRLDINDAWERDRPARLGAESDWASVAATAGGVHTLALKRNGSLWAWGDNGFGQLGLGNAEDRDRPTRVGDDGDWASVAAGEAHTLALKRDGSLWVWGDNKFGQLGLGDRDNRETPTRLPGLDSS